MPQSGNEDNPSLPDWGTLSIPSNGKIQYVFNAMYICLFYSL